MRTEGQLIYWDMNRKPRHPAKQKSTGCEQQKGYIPGKREQLADALRLPKDMLFGAPILTATGNHELWVENYKGILEYSRDSIRLQAGNCQISICGSGLLIDYYTSEDMKIVGEIRCISYL